jgi:hypothetical protein
MLRPTNEGKEAIDKLSVHSVVTRHTPQHEKTEQNVYQKLDKGKGQHCH